MILITYMTLSVKLLKISPLYRPVGRLAISREEFE